ncbi:MAG: FAD-dependent oxidoreductase [Muribaculaceae bacterium]|nr:FAD-dependent oxidoreductase [Muribaculaceae bacterium]
MNIVIVGGVAAGAKAASKIKRLLPDSKVSIFTDDTHVSYSSCGLPYYIQGNFRDYTALLVRSVEEFNQLGIDVFLKSKVEKILVDKKQILVSEEKSARLVEYDKLILATGARPFIPNVTGNSRKDNVFSVRKIEDGINIRERMLKSSHATIIGSGFIGMELLEAFIKNGLNVSLIEKNDKIMSMFDDELSDIITSRLLNGNDGKFEILTNEIVSEFTGKDSVETVKTLSGKEFKTDMVVFCAGVKPNIEIAADAGIEIGSTGAIKVNRLMQTSVQDIYACGDCCEKRHLVSGKSVWIPLGSTANKEGRCAAINAAGGFEQFDGVLGSAVTRCLNTTMSMTGLTEHEAREIGFNPVSVIVQKDDIVGYMPEVGEIILKVVADKVTGLLLGAQAVGSIGADKRINSLTSALLAHMTVEEYSKNDLTYSPPYSPTIDPLINAMLMLRGKIDS